MKRVSVIIPVYNAEKNIGKCLESIIPQLTEADELILLNDGSSDDTISVLKEYERKNKNVVVVDKHNEGVALTRNKGIELATGKYILFVDNDDYLDNDYIDTYYNAIETGGFDCVIGGYRRVTEKGIKFQVKAHKSEWYKLMVVAPWAKIYKTSFIKDNQLSFLNYGIGEDNYFSLSLYSKTKNIGYIDYSGYNWWFNEESVSNTSQRGFNPNIDILFLLDKLIAITGNQGLYKYYYVRYVIWYLLFSGRFGTDKEFIYEYKRYINWLEKNDVKVEFPVLSSEINGEPLKNRIAIKMVIIAHKLGIMNLFSRLYCKG